MRKKVPISEVSRSIPEELKEASILRLFNEVARQNQKRGWALLLPADISEMGVINTLEGCGLIAVEPDSQRFDLSGRAKSAEVVCQLTEAGQLVASALSAKTR